MSSTTELQTWLNGTPTGGPNGDGRYPMTAKDGQVYLVYCPAAQALNPALAELPVELFAEAAAGSAAVASGAATTAEAARIAAQGSASTASAAATTATTANTNAQAAKTTAETARDQAVAAANSIVSPNKASALLLDPDYGDQPINFSLSSYDSADASVPVSFAVLMNINAVDNRVAQMAIGSQSDQFYWRGHRSASGGWQPWRKIWHDGNFDPTTVALSANTWGTGVSSNGTRALSYGSGTDLNVARGFHAFYTNGGTNRPAGGNGLVWGLSTTVSDTEYGVQEWGRANRRFFRTIEAGTWGNWLEYYHTGNFDPATKVTVGGSFADYAGSSPLYWAGNSGLDLNNLLPGQRVLVSTTGNSNVPPTESGTSFWYVECMRSYTSDDYRQQVAYSYNGTVAKTLHRHYHVSNGWSPWAQTWTSGNFDPSTKLDKAGDSMTGNLWMSATAAEKSIGWAMTSRNVYFYGKPDGEMGLYDSVLGSRWFTDTTGKLHVKGRVISEGSYFNSTTTAVVLGCAAGGTAYVRPNGTDNSAYELLVNTSGVSWNAQSIWHAGNAPNAADTNNGYRLGQVPPTINNCNDAIYNGWYMGSSMANAPNSSTAWFMIHVSRHNPIWIQQEAFIFTDGAHGLRWRRHMLNGTWGAWTAVQQMAGDGNPGLGAGTAALTLSGAYGGAIRMIDGTAHGHIHMQNDYTMRLSVGNGGVSERVQITSDADAYLIMNSRSWIKHSNRSAGLWYSDSAQNRKYFAGLMDDAEWGVYATDTSWRFTISADGRPTIKNANSATMTKQPRIFVQSGDPGAAAADGDLWIW